jgi:hypothetical protein
MGQGSARCGDHLQIARPLDRTVQHCCGFSENTWQSFMNRHYVISTRVHWRHTLRPPCASRDSQAAFMNITHMAHVCDIQACRLGQSSYKAVLMHCSHRARADTAESFCSQGFDIVFYRIHNNDEKCCQVVLQFAQVKPTSCITYDAMHCVLSNGIAQNETALLLFSLRDHGCTFDKLRTFASARWGLCSALASTLSVLTNIFSEAREKAWKKSHDFKCGASEMLLAFPIILFFLQTVIVGLGMDDQIASYEKLGRIMHYIRLGKDRGMCGLNLRAAIHEHGDAFDTAYPDAVWKPKNHFIHHVPEHLERDGIILDAFVGERKHQVVKLCAANIKHTVTFDKSVILRVLAHQLSILCDAEHFCDKLMNGKALDGTAAFVSNSMQFAGTKFSRGDCIMVRGVLCIVKVCVAVDDQFFISTRRYLHHSKVKWQILNAWQFEQCCTKHCHTKPHDTGMLNRRYKITSSKNKKSQTIGAMLTASLHQDS